VRIALISEGCYPFARGGVTTWCDQLIRGLPQHDFEVVALLGDGSEPVIMELPNNVTGLRRLPLWGPSRRNRVPRGSAWGDFEASFALVLSALLRNHPGALSDFVSGLRGMHRWAQGHDLHAALTSERATQMVLEHSHDWSEHEAAYPMSLQDALVTTDLLEHSLRPLSQPAPNVDLCHPVSNGLPTLVAMMAQWTYGTPLVMSEHGVYLRERYLAFQDFNYGWPVKQVLLAFYRRLSEAGYAAADVIAPVNVFNQRWELQGGADPDRIVTAYNGVNPQGFSELPEPTVPTIGWVGRIDPLKDLETLVRGFATFRDKVPASKLRMFGPVPAGNEGYARHIRDLVERLGLNDAATFEGPVSPVSEAYRASSVVALTSISEGLPYTVIEAMMSWRVTVSSDVGGVAEVVGDTGLLFPAREPEEFSRACVTLMSDASMRSGMAMAGRARATGMFDLDQMLGAFGSMYAEALESARLNLGDARGPAPYQVAPRRILDEALTPYGYQTGP
jgi:polysaccharide biosynthesis protein PelF